MGTDKRLGALFVELAKPNQNGKSDWIDVKNVPVGYEELNVTNGSSWSRQKSDLAEKYVVEKKYGNSRGKPLEKVRLNGFKKNNE